MKPPSKKNKKTGLPIKYDRSSGAYHKEYRKLKKKQDPSFYKSHQLRSNWKARARSLGVEPLGLPSAPEIRAWLDSQKPYKCYYTAENISEKDIGLDHKVPIARGGTYSLDNVVITSKAINGAKGQMTEEEFRQLLKLISYWEDGGKNLLMRLKASGHIFKTKQCKYQK